ncbi:unnamed protein product [Brassica rapa]|uniref:Uncharacterized protein n=1 Tax=Brassica campestris TaxID=3711 RepID=A0A8D9MEM8_BRACM|nr:unnamed protein product [Brassica rapa]
MFLTPLATIYTSTSVTLLRGGVSTEQDRDHDQGENQKLIAKAEEDNDEKHKPSTEALSYHNVSQQEFRVVIPRPKLLPGLHVQITYSYSQKWFFLSVWSHAQLTLASRCVINSSVVTMQPVSAMCDWQGWEYLQICSVHELLFFFLKLQPDGFFSH